MGFIFITNKSHANMTKTEQIKRVRALLASQVEQLNWYAEKLEQDMQDSSKIGKPLPEVHADLINSQVDRFYKLLEDVDAITG